MSALLGLLPAYYGGLREAVELVERREADTNGSNTSRTVTFGETVQEHDGILLIARNNGSVAPTTPSGFTRIAHTASGTLGDIFFYWRLAPASPSQAYTVSGYDGSATTHRLHGYLVRAPVGALAIASAGAVVHDVAATSAACGPSAINVAGGSLVVAAASAESSTNQDTYSFDNQFDEMRQVNEVMESAMRSYPIAQSGQNTTASWATSRDVRTGLIEIAFA